MVLRRAEVFINYGGAPPPVYKTEEKTRRHVIQEEEPHRVTPKEKEFKKSVEVQETQQERFSNLLKGLPEKTFSMAGPTFFPKEEKKFKGVTIIPSRSQVGEFVVKETYNIGSRGVGTLKRLQIAPKKQVTERPIETIETAINIGGPITARGVSVLRTPTSVKFVGTSTDDIVTGVGKAERVLGKPKGFGFQTTKEGEIVTDTSSLTAARGDIITKVSPTGEGVTASRTIITNVERGTTRGLKVSEQSGVVQVKESLVGARSVAAQTTDITAIKGGTTEGARFEGLIKQVSSKSDNINRVFGRSQITKTEPITETKATEIGTKISSELTTTKPTTIKPISSSIVDIKTKGMPTSNIFTEGKTKTSGALSFRIETSTKGKEKLGLGEDIKERTKSRQKTDIVSDVPIVSESIRQGQLTKIRPSLDTPLKPRTTQKIIPKTTTILIPKIPILPIPNIGPPKLFPSIKSSKKILKKETKRIQPKKRTPTLFSQAEGITGKRSKYGEISGLGIRPIIKEVKKMPKKKRRRKKK